MNINQQSEIEELFKRISKSMAKNSKSTVSDEDINKVRAYVVHSQRPLQAVRLLQKEREERLVDHKFTSQKDNIISQAKELDRNARDFKSKQAMMVSQVESDLEPALKGQLMRKKKDEELERENARAKLYEQKIVELQESTKNRKGDLTAQQHQLLEHKKFSDFLEGVVRNPALTSESSSDSQSNSIDGLRARFINLKTENMKLKQRKVAIDKECEDIRQNEQNELQRMTAIMFTKSREMQELQKQIEEFSSKNSNLEQEFEHEITKQNENNKAIKVIFNAVNNMYDVVYKYDKLQPRYFKGRPYLTENISKKPEAQKQFVDDLLGILYESKEAMSDLKRVANKMKLSEKELEQLKKESVDRIHNAQLTAGQTTTGQYQVRADTLKETKTKADSGVTSATTTKIQN